MKICINHIALNVKPDTFDWYVDFFRTICGMRSYREDGETQKRRIWFTEGIQLNECSEDLPVRGICDHLGLHADDVQALVTAALSTGCSPVSGKENWFMLPDGMKVEVKKYE